MQMAGMIIATVFLFNQLIKALTLYSVQYLTGLLVKHKGVKVNYTRKINHFVLFLVPVYVDRAFAYEESFGYFILGAVAAVISLIIYIEPVRTRIKAISLMFLSFDRPEDRPHTLLWLSTQIAAGYLVLIPMVVLYYYYDLLHLMFLPVLINGIGDGLAEPVGVRFGRHRYQTRALFTGKKYVRSLEGSACVFLTSLIVIVVMRSYFSHEQFVVTLLVVPILMTLTEAISPHTWDTPFIFLVGYLSLFAISFV
jgi:dolichol kinase